MYDKQIMWQLMKYFWCVLMGSDVYQEKQKVLKLNPVEQWQVQECMQKIHHLVLSFRVCYLENLVLVSVVVQLYPFNPIDEFFMTYSMRLLKYLKISLISRKGFQSSDNVFSNYGEKLVFKRIRWLKTRLIFTKQVTQFWSLIFVISPVLWIWIIYIRFLP